jgi:multiple antibiotic resistance protein
MIRDVLSFTLIAFSALFFVVDPPGVVPVFISLTEGDSEDKRRSMALRACVITVAVLVVFALFGQLIFKLFSVTLAAFKIAGGVLVMITALDMLSSRRSPTKTSDPELAEGRKKADIAIVPLAMPLLAGPGAIATTMVLQAQAHQLWQSAVVMAAIVATAFSAYLCLRAAVFLDRKMGAGVRAIFERVMGLMLAAIAVQFMIGGIRDAFPEIFH